MAVSKIRKLSSSILLGLSVLSIVVFVLFFAGGSTVDAKDNKVYEYTGLMLYWTYALGAVTILATLGFAVLNFLTSFQRDSKAALTSVSGVLALVAVLVVSYLAGSGTPLQGLNADSQKFNTEGWLKLTDMWLYSTYILFTVLIVVVVWGAVSKAFAKK